MAVTPLWVAFYDKIATSPDGITWTQKLDISSPFEFVQNMSWDGQQTFVGSGSVIVTSTDGGVTWTTTLADTFPVLEYDLGRSEVSAAAWNGTVWCVVGNSGGNSTSDVFSTTTFTSTTGSSWTPHVLGFGNGSTFSGIAWSDVNQLFVACGLNSSGVGVIYSSPDGVTWTLQHTATGDPTQNLTNVIWNGIQFLVLGQDFGAAYAFTSPDGTTWTETAAIGVGNTSGAYNQFIWDTLTAAYYVCDGSGNLQRSNDGITWAKVITASGNVSCDTIARSGAILITDGGEFQTSTDGITWTVTDPTNNSNKMEPLASNGTVIAAVTNNSNGVSTTADHGVTWVSRLSDPTHYISMYFFGSQPTTPSSTTTLFASGLEELIYTSHDLGQTWTKTHFTASGDSIQTIVTNGTGTFVAAGTHKLWYSTDGDTWNSITFGIGGHTYLFNDVGRPSSPFIIWDGSQFVIAGRDVTATLGCIGTSADGITWTVTNIAGTRCLGPVAIHSGLYVLIDTDVTTFTPSKFYTSSNLTTLTLRYTAIQQTEYGTILGFLGGQWVAFSSGGTDSWSAASVDGVTWAESPAAVGHPGQFAGCYISTPGQLIYNNNINLYVGTGITTVNTGVASSSDNLTWTFRDEDGTTGIQLDSVYQIGTTMYAYYGSSGSPNFTARLHSSTDGISWTPVTPFGTQGWSPFSLTPINNYYLAIGSGPIANAILISPNTQNWANLISDPNFDLNNITVLTTNTPPPPGGSNQTVIQINT